MFIQVKPNHSDDSTQERQADDKSVCQNKTFIQMKTKDTDELTHDRHADDVVLCQSKVCIRKKPKDSDGPIRDIQADDKSMCHYRHLETCLRISGVYCDPFGKRSIHGAPQSCRTKVLNFITSFNTFMFQIMYLILFLRTASLLKPNEGFSVWNLIVICLCCTFIALLTVCVTMSYLFPRHLPRVLKRIQTTCKKDIKVPVKYFTILMILVECSTAILMPVAYRNIMFPGAKLVPSLSDRIRLYPFYPQSAYGLWAAYEYVYFTSVALSSFLMAALVLFVICFLLGREFTRITADLEDCLDKDSHILQKDMEQLRMHFESVCKLVAEADAFLQYSILFGSFFGIPYFCFGLYSITRGDVPEDSTGAVYFLMLASIFQIIFFAFAGSFLNSRAHSAKDILLRCSVTNMDDETFKTISLFLSRLSGPPIGITMFGTFTIDRASTLTVLGTILSYAVLVLQLSPTSSASNCNSYNDTAV